MTTEQNEAQAQPSQGQIQAQAPVAGQSPNAGQNQGHRRRRRKRNKGQGKQQGAAAQQNGQNSQGSSPQPTPQPQAQQQPQGQKSKPPKRFFQKNSNYGNGNSGNSYSNGNGNGRMQGNNGNGNGNGGGARRKGKQRRQQVFVGPMDHSYRAANGNVADSSQNNSQAEFRGMPHSGFYPDSDLYGYAPSQPIREDAPTRIFFFIEDLFFLAKIQEVSKKLGVKVGFLKAGKETLAQLTETEEDARPSLIVFDLNNANVKPLAMIPKLKAKLKRGTSIIGFLSHLQGDLKVKAIEAGCDMVMPRSAFSQNLPNLLRRHGIEEEEMETVEA